MKKNMEAKQNLEVVKQYLVQQEVAFRCNERAGVILIDFADACFKFSASDEQIQLDFFMHLPEPVFRQVFDFMKKANQALPERRLEIETVSGCWNGYRITARIEKETPLQVSKVEEMLDTCRQIGLPLVTWICNNANRKSGW